MSEMIEQPVEGLVLRIDQSLCVGFGHCVEEAPVAFRLGDSDVVEPLTPDRASRADLVRACEACPVAALTLLEAGVQVAP